MEHQDLVELTEDGRIIVCALAAPGNPNPGPLFTWRERRTFWTACASCKEKSKHPIECLNCNISCPECSETFIATEVSRPRKKRTTTVENVDSGAIVTLPGTMAEPSKMTPTVDTPPRKKVKKDINATQAAIKHGDNIQGSFNEQKTNTIIERNIIHHEERDQMKITDRITENEINMFLFSKGWNMVKNMKMQQ